MLLQQRRQGVHPQLSETFTVDQKAMALVLASHDSNIQSGISPEDVGVLLSVLGEDQRRAYLKSLKTYKDHVSATKKD